MLPPGDYDVASGQPVSLIECAEWAFEAAGLGPDDWKTFCVEHHPPERAVPADRAADLSWAKEVGFSVRYSPRALMAELVTAARERSGAP